MGQQTCSKVVVVDDVEVETVVIVKLGGVTVEVGVDTTVTFCVRKNSK